MTTGVADPDPAPPTATSEATGPGVVSPTAAPTTGPGDNRFAVVAGALVLLAAFYVYRSRKN